MAVRRLRGKAWGNALGGYKFQKRGPGGKFGSGFVGSVGNKSVSVPSAGQRRASYLKKDARKARAKKAAKIVGVTAVAAGVGYAGYKASYSRRHFGVQKSPMTTVVHDVGTKAGVRSAPAYTGKVIRKARERYSAPIPDGMNSLGMNAGKTKMKTKSGKTYQRVSAVVDSFAEESGKIAKSAGAAAAAVSSVNQVKKSIQESNQDRRIDRNTGISSTLADRGVLPSGQMASTRGVMEVDRRIEAHRSLPRPQNPRPDSRGIAGTASVPVGHRPRQQDASDYDGGDWLESQKTSAMFRERAHAGDYILGDPAAKSLPQNTAKKHSTSVSNMKSGVGGRIGRGTENVRVSASSQAVPKLMAKKGIRANPVTNFDSYGFGIDHAVEQEKRRRNSNRINMQDTIALETLKNDVLSRKNSPSNLPGIVRGIERGRERNAKRRNKKMQPSNPSSFDPGISTYGSQSELLKHMSPKQAQFARAVEKNYASGRPVSKMSADVYKRVMGSAADKRSVKGRSIPRNIPKNMQSHYEKILKAEGLGADHAGLPNSIQIAANEVPITDLYGSTLDFGDYIGKQKSKKKHNRGRS